MESPETLPLFSETLFSSAQEKPRLAPERKAADPPAAARKSPAFAEGDAARRRERYAFLVNLHEASLVRLARRLCAGDEDRAQDLVQDALIRGYKAFLNAQFTEGTNARAWFSRILVNCFLSDHRRDKWKAGANFETLTSHGEGGPAETHAPPADDPDAALMNSVLEEPIEKAMAALPEGQRLCVWLVDVEEWDYAEVAKALKIPVGTVRSRLSSARLKLHTRLLDYARTIRKVKE